MQLTVVRIPTTGDPRNVEALTTDVEGLVVVIDVKYRFELFRVTHTSSGRKLKGFGRLADALAFVGKIGPAADWTVKQVDLPKGMADAMNKAYREVIGGGI